MTKTRYKNALLIDGHNFLFRGFYGVPPEAKRRDGTPINAVYGFFALLRQVANEIQPTHVAIAFDSETSCESKKAENPDYKANRPEIDVSIFQQLPVIKRCLDLMEIRWIEHKRYEADDIIGTLARRFAGAESHSHIVSNDHDFMQLVSKRVFVIRGHHGKSAVFDEEAVLNRFGVKPSQYLDYLALVGDSTDNVRGIRGVGPKIASSLLQRHGTALRALKFLHQEPSSIKDKLSDKGEFLRSQKEFLKIRTDLSIPRKFSKRDFEFDSEKLADRMGIFLDENWDRLNQQ